MHLPPFFSSIFFLITFRSYNSKTTTLWREEKGKSVALYPVLCNYLRKRLIYWCWVNSKKDHLRLFTKRTTVLSDLLPYLNRIREKLVSLVGHMTAMYLYLSIWTQQRLNTLFHNDHITTGRSRPESKNSSVLNRLMIWIGFVHVHCALQIKGQYRRNI